MRKIYYVYIGLIIISIVGLLIFFNTNFKSVTYEDGGEGLQIKKVTFRDKEKIKYIDSRQRVVVDLDDIDFGGEVIDVAPFQNGYAKIAVVQEDNSVKMCFIGIEGNIAFEINLADVPVTSYDDSRYMYQPTTENLPFGQDVFKYYGVSNVVNDRVIIAERSPKVCGIVSAYNTKGELLYSKNLANDFEKRYRTDYTKHFNFEVNEIGFIVSELGLTSEDTKDRYMDTNLEIVSEFDNPQLLQILKYEDGINYVSMWDIEEGYRFYCYLDSNGNNVDGKRYDAHWNELIR